MEKVVMAVIMVETAESDITNRKGGSDGRGGEARL
jgi:hypothetical protein